MPPLYQRRGGVSVFYNSPRKGGKKREKRVGHGTLKKRVAEPFCPGGKGGRGSLGKKERNLIGKKPKGEAQKKGREKKKLQPFGGRK